MATLQDSIREIIREEIRREFDIRATIADELRICEQAAVFGEPRSHMTSKPPRSIERKDYD